MGIRILIVDDHKLVRDGIHALLDLQNGIDVIATAENGWVAVQLARKLNPDVILMDVSMPGMSGSDATHHILSEQPDIKVIALSMHSEKSVVESMLRVGVMGYVLKDCSIEELCFAIRAVMKNKTYFSQEITGAVVKGYLERMTSKSRRKPSVLTQREYEVLGFIAEGMNTREIAQHLSLSVKTIETHRRQIMEKTGVKSIAELTKYAIREGITTL
jgi:DNA-binding NarL/FixJ family response regulator